MKNFKFIAILLCMMFSPYLFAQEYELNVEAEFAKVMSEINEGENFILTKILHEKNLEGKDVFYFYDDRDNFVIDKLRGKEENDNRILGKLNEMFNFKYKTVQNLWDVQMLDEVIPNLLKKGAQVELRREGEKETLDYLEKIKGYGLEFNDPFLKDYIYSLILKIAPSVYMDGRKSDINVFLFQNPEINARVFPNGTIVINTGLLASLRSEDELVAVLANEIAHFVLDHSIINVNKEILRKKRAEFWAAIATGLTAFGEGFAAANTNYYVPGLATLGMVALSAEISSKVIDHLGMKYDKEQEAKADEIAIKILEILGYNKNALSTALYRIKEQYMAERSFDMFYDSEIHEKLVERIYRNGVVVDLKDVDYERMISFAITNMAAMKFENKRFTQCITFSSLNILNNVATSDDYVLKANCLLATKNTKIGRAHV